MDYASLPPHPQPPTPVWRKVGGVFAVTHALIPVTYHVILALAGFDLIDMWGGGSVRPLRPGADQLVGPGHVFANIGMLLALPTLLLGGVVFVLGICRRHARSWGVGLAVMATAFIAGCESLRMAAILVGL